MVRQTVGERIQFTIGKGSTAAVDGDMIREPDGHVLKPCVQASVVGGERHRRGEA